MDAPFVSQEAAHSRVRFDDYALYVSEETLHSRVELAMNALHVGAGAAHSRLRSDDGRPSRERRGSTLESGAWQ